MTSTLDNCIFLNAFSKDQNLFNDSSIDYLLNLSEFDLPWLNEYYARSERIICKIKELNLDNTETWTDISDTYVKDVVDKLKGGRYSEVVSIIPHLLGSLESKYGV